MSRVKSSSRVQQSVLANELAVNELKAGALVIAADPRVMAAFGRCLEMAFDDVPVRHVCSIAAAVHEMGSDPAGLVLLDSGVLGSNGSAPVNEVCRDLRSATLVVQVESGMEALGLDAVSCGAQAYVVKGEDGPGLTARILRCAMARGHADLELRVREERLALAFGGAGQGLFDWDLASDEVFYSSHFGALLDLEARDLVDRPQRWFERIHPDDLATVKSAVNDHLTGRTSCLKVDFRALLEDKQESWFQVQGRAACDDHGRPYRLAGSLTDIHSQKVVEKQIWHDAMHDALTKLPNRSVFLDRVSLALATLDRNEQAQFAVLFIDLDHFKKVNDSLGHAAGDELLIGIADRLERLVRPQDTLTRLCGDEFAILVADAREPDVAVRVGERVIRSLSEPFQIAGQAVTVSASVGIAMSSTGYDSADQILHDADLAMYRSKAGGRSRCQLFDAAMHEGVMALLKMEVELEQAVEAKAFIMHYQPIVCLVTDSIVGFEGLVRWQHPENGLVTPTQFLAVAESTGIMVPIGWFTLEESCRQMAEWRKEFPSEPGLWLSVNVSHRLLMQADMVERLLSILESTGLEPQTLRLEVTENLIAQHGEPAITRLLELSALGVRFSVDDFGERFDSIKVFDRVRFDSLKIDPRFIEQVDEQGRAPFLLQTILSMAGSLGMSVVAEGVERSSQRESLKRLRCPQGQGFLFSRPVPAVDAQRLLAAGSAWQG